MIEVKVPVLGESITTAVIANINKSEGDFVSEDEIILELETEKINLEITAPSAGKLGEINVTIDQEVKVDDIVALLDETQVGETNVEQSEVLKPEAEPELVEIKQEELTEEQTEKVAEFKQDIQANLGLSTQVDLEDLSPAVRALVLEHNVDLARVNASGKNGRILKSDILEYVENSSGFGSHHAQVKTNDKASRAKTTQRIPQIRKTIAKRLKDSQNTAAMLATFNEVDLSNVNKIRKSLKADFIEKNGVSLGYMSFFTKACCKALQHFEKVNAYYQEDQNQIELHEYCDISIAVASEKGLFVPVIRNAEQMSFAQIEHTIKDYGQKAKEGKLTSQELSGGTFSITNGGVFGSMLSTPIINQPQSAILGMHNIIQRPVAVDGKVEIRPMMYLALSYDHRIIDGKDAVSFLVMVKDLLENPEKLMFDL